ncbi:hypothetical protein [Nostoc sp. UHCC 0870]|uniref:hypothetical protein n=1 Tax=Nostoc sp. UHCC 0870 TaxID=2914041 RepID=UPI001EDFF773|nr:hypothetical protein [Nostoc sp. UHCC 0870]UKO96577.1 hypothetical protein L6494_18395 [Nostoc sp. UHCC 0870]
MSSNCLKSLPLFGWLTPLTLAASMVIISNTSAPALQFNLTDAPATTIDQMLGDEMASRDWSNYLADNVTVIPSNNNENGDRGESLNQMISSLYALDWNWDWWRWNGYWRDLWDRLVG